MSDISCMVSLIVFCFLPDIEKTFVPLFPHCNKSVMSVINDYRETDYSIACR